MNNAKYIPVRQVYLYLSKRVEIEAVGLDEGAGDVVARDHGARSSGAGTLQRLRG